MIHGKCDLVIPLDLIKSTGERCTKFVVLENNAHLVPIESPKEYAELISAFVNGQ